MKKLLVVLSFILISLCSINTSVYAFEPVSNLSTSDTTIVKFDYYPGGSLSSERTLVFQWFSEEEMKDLKILLYIPSENQNKVIFDISWDLENMDTELEVDFEMVAPPADDPETPDIDETMGQTWTYKVTFPVVDQTLGVLKFVFDYNSGDKDYRNIFYMSNIVYPTPDRKSVV